MFIIFIFLSDLRPKGRGRPQRILLGQWPEDHVRDVIRAVVFREGDLGSTASPPAPTSSPQHFAAAGTNQEGLHGPSQATPAMKTEPSDHHPEASHASHPLATESKAAQAAFEAQMKQFYNNPFASQLLAASSKMFTSIDLNPFLQNAVKIEAPEEDNFEDADHDQNQERNEAIGTENDECQDRNVPVDLVTHSHKSIDAIASKLVHNTVESSAASDAAAASHKESIKNNVLNCSEEIRKTMQTVGDKDNVPLVSACSQERKSV